MKSNWINSCFVEGYIFNHTLEKKVTGPNSKNPGSEYIRGKINVATDPDGLNVISVNFTYVTAVYKSGKENQTYNTLASIIETGKTFEQVGKEATKVRINGNIGLNEFITKDGEIAIPKQFEGSFVHFSTSSLSGNASTFEADMVITGTETKEVENGNDYMNLKGYIFDFRNNILPITFSISNKDGMKYFEKCKITSKDPLVTKVWGEIVCTTIETKRETESAFGAPTVKTTSRTLRAWNVTGASAEPMEFGEDGVISMDELKKALADREDHLADIRERDAAYKASRMEKKDENAFVIPAANDAYVSDDDFVF